MEEGTSQDAWQASHQLWCAKHGMKTCFPPDPLLVFILQGTPSTLRLFMQWRQGQLKAKYRRQLQQILEAVSAEYAAQKLQQDLNLKLEKAHTRQVQSAIMLNAR
jgi:hypothetical protein